MNLNLLLVTFSLRNPLKDYTQFFVQLRGNAYQWWHFIEQTCVVVTNHDSHTFAQLLIPHIEKTDSILVAKIEPFQYQGWLPKEAWDWLNRVSTEVKRPFLPVLPPLPPPPGLKE